MPRHINNPTAATVKHKIRQEIFLHSWIVLSRPVDTPHVLSVDGPTQPSVGQHGLGTLAALISIVFGEGAIGDECVPVLSPPEGVGDLGKEMAVGD